MSGVDGAQPWGIGRTPSFVYQSDPRFSYWMYVPRRYAHSPPAHRRMLIAVHGTERDAPLLRSMFEEFAERTGVLVVAPHFPAGLGEPHDVHAYKYLRGYGVNYDEILLGMVAQVAERYRTDADRFLMFGFSGGAHFAHRFWYLYPERLRAIAVAAPGSVTLPDAAARWWVGIGGIEEKFGRRAQIEAMREVPALLAVGAEDTAVDLITHLPTSPYWMTGANSAGGTRVERLRRLHQMLDARGVPSRLRELPGVTHEYRPLVIAAAEFFEEVVEEI